MEFLSPKSTPKPLAPINDQNFEKGRPVFLFKLVFEIRFSDALLSTKVIIILTAEKPFGGTVKRDLILKKRSRHDRKSNFFNIRKLM